MTGRDVPPSLKDLKGRLEAARSRQETARDKGGRGQSSMSGSGLGFGLRIAVDLLAGLVIGVVLGLVLDHWLNTTPLMLVVFLFLGAAAGMLNVYRAATGRGLAVGYGKPAEGKASGKDDGDEGPAKPAETGTGAANGGERGSGGKS